MIVLNIHLKKYSDLPLKQALVIIALKEYGWTIERTARELNLTVNTVRVCEAKARLQGAQALPVKAG